METRLRRFDGEYRWFLLCASPLRDVAGQMVKWYGLSSDIEDRKRAEETVKVAHTQIVDSIPALVAVMTPAGEVEIVNRAVLEYFGKTLEELKGWATTNAVHPDDLPVVVAVWNGAVATGRPYEVESRHRRADGVYRWFNVCGFPMRDKDGRIVRWCVLQTDVDDRRRSEALLTGEKQLLEMLARGYSFPLSSMRCVSFSKRPSKAAIAASY